LHRRGFGLAEAILCLATLLQGFRLHLRPGWPVMPACRLTLRPGDSLPMRLEPRGPNAGARGSTDPGTGGKEANAGARVRPSVSGNAKSGSAT